MLLVETYNQVVDPPDHDGLNHAMLSLIFSSPNKISKIKIMFQLTEGLSCSIDNYYLGLPRNKGIKGIFTPVIRILEEAKNRGGATDETLVGMEFDVSESDKISDLQLFGTNNPDKTATFARWELDPNTNMFVCKPGANFIRDSQSIQIPLQTYAQMIYKTLHLIPDSILLPNG